MNALDLLEDLTAEVDIVVDETHGVDGEEVWRTIPVPLDEFVRSREHLDLPRGLFPRQLAACHALLGEDPTLIFEEPTTSLVPLSWWPIRGSSNIRKLGWHDFTLYVEYKDRSVYQYGGVERDVFELLTVNRPKGVSVGKQLHLVVKGLPYEKLPASADEVKVVADAEGRRYQMAVLLWGKGSGKDFLCSVVVTYLVYVLLCLRDPQGYFLMARGEPIDIVNVAYNADQAKKVFFEKLKERIKGWRWLRDNYNVFESAKRVGDHRHGRAEVHINDGEVVFPRKIRCFSRHSENESYEGYNVIAWIMDEASAFLSKLKRENADKIYQTLRTSAASRFQRRWVGFVISYPRHGDDFTMTMHAQAVREPDLGVYPDGPAASWHINENLGRAEFVTVRGDHEVPVELANDYMLDFEEALARYECKPPAARDAFFKYPTRLDDAVAAGKDPMIEWEPGELRRTVPGADGESITRLFRTVRITKMRRAPKGAKFYAHGDPGLKHDSFALAIAHGVPATVMMRVPAGEVLDAQQMARQNAALRVQCRDEEEYRARALTSTTLIEWERDVVRTVVDALIEWKPDPSRDMQVDLQNIEDTILMLAKRYRLGFPAKGSDGKPRPTITFDHWNSAATVQKLQAKKLNVEDEAWSGPFQLDIYRNARTNFYNDLVTLPDTPSVTSNDPQHPGVLYELKRIELIEDRKVDHPEGGSKDLADAVVRVIQHVTEAGKSRFVFAGAFGHSAKYEGRGPIIPSTERKVDPTRAPDARSPDDYRRDAERQTEQPLGELVPSEGTVNGRRLAFGSVGGR